MGWSWALYFANEIVCHQVSTSSMRPGYDEIRDRQPPPRLLPGQPVVGTYVDNVHVFGGRPGEAGQRMDAIAEHFGRLGIPFEVDGVEHLHHMVSLGMRLSFDKGRSTAMAKPERAWKLWHATRGLLRRRRLSGELLRIYLGLTNFHFQFEAGALRLLRLLQVRGRERWTTGHGMANCADRTPFGTETHFLGRVRHVVPGLL